VAFLVGNVDGHDFHEGLWLCLQRSIGPHPEIFQRGQLRGYSERKEVQGKAPVWYLGDFVPRSCTNFNVVVAFLTFMV